MVLPMQASGTRPQPMAAWHRELLVRCMAGLRDIGRQVEGGNVSRKPVFYTRVGSLVGSLLRGLQPTVVGAYSCRRLQSSVPAVVGAPVVGTPLSHGRLVIAHMSGQGCKPNRNRSAMPACLPTIRYDGCPHPQFFLSIVVSM